MRILPYGAISLAGIALLIPVLNPGQQAYADHVISKLQDKDCRQEVITLEQRLLCQTVNTLPRSMTKKIVLEYSSRQNFVFFSLYRTKLPGIENQSLGVAGLFFEKPESRKD